MNFVAPCRDCDKHNERCHSSCEEYKAWRAELDARNERRHKIKDVETALMNRNTDMVDRAYKKQANWGRVRRKRVGQ